MSFNDTYRFGVHAVIYDPSNRILMLKQTYGDCRWGLPGGGVEKGETVKQAIIRECFEELGMEIIIEAFTGIYYHSKNNAQVGIFRCLLPEEHNIVLSYEHSEYAWFNIEGLDIVQKIRVKDALKCSNGNIYCNVF